MANTKKKHLDEMTAAVSASPEPSLSTSPNRPMNYINEELSELVNPSVQGNIDNLKSAGYNFNVDDTAYRMKRFHPDITREQVDEVYRSIPIIGSTRHKGNILGAYNGGNSDPSRDRIMIYNALNPNENFSSTINHEVSHAYLDKLYGGELTQEEHDYLQKAYPTSIFREDEDSDIERHAVNKQLRGYFSDKYGAIKEDFDKLITDPESISDDEIMTKYFQLNGYTSDHNNGKYLQADPYKGANSMKKNGVWDPDKVRNIREAMKYVASNNFSLNNRPSILRNKNTNDYDLA